MLRDDSGRSANSLALRYVLHEEKPYAIFSLFLCERFVYDDVVVVLVGDKRNTPIPYF